MKTLLDKVRKRDGSIVNFDADRITDAIYKSMLATNTGLLRDAEFISACVVNEINQIRQHHNTFIPTVEGIQDSVERALIMNQYADTAKAYILYREQHAALRRKRRLVPEKIRNLAAESNQYFHNTFNEFTYLQTCARWNDEKQRREFWVETVARYIDFMRENLGNKLNPKEYQELQNAILNHEIVPSMRLLQFAGKAAHATNVCGYDCAYIAPTSLQDFGEILYLVMCEVGVGFSVESANIQNLPIIKRQTGEMLTTHIIPDSKEGWCYALVLGMTTWAAGQDIKFDYSELRPIGAHLQTTGGKTTGPGPLRSLLAFTRKKMLQRQDRRLSNLDAHDILCKIRETIASESVRRGMISLSDLDDTGLRDAKKDFFYYTDPHRSIANNYAVYITKPSNHEFTEEWLALMKSGLGERGIFNRAGLIKTLPKRRLKLLSLQGYIHGDIITSNIGTSPCCGIILRSKSFGSFSEIVARSTDDEKSLLKKIRLATILSTYQTTLTKFPYLSKEWQKNCQEDPALGVSITGQWDCKAVRCAETLGKLKEKAISVNKAYAKRFASQPAAAVTCIKPSDTISQIVDCTADLHQHYAPYYIHRIRITATDPLFKMLRYQEVPHYPEVGQNKDTATTFVLEFPIKAPPGAVFKHTLSAIDQLEYWKKLKLNYTEHNPSATILVNDNEWIKVANWVYTNWDIIGGLSFLPRTNHIDHLVPYEEIDEKTYKKLTKQLEKVDFSQIILYERQDETNLSRS